MTHEPEHSLFSASGADGWMHCHGKPLMERGRRTTSRYADEGTAAHTLADWVLVRRIAGERVSAAAYIGRKIEVKRDGEPPTSFEVDADFAEHVDTYVNGFLAACDQPGALRYAERRVYYNEALGVPRHLAFGTSDGVAILLNAPAIVWRDIAFSAGNEIQIHDLKFGQGVRVFADGPQMKHYALGVLQDFELVADFDRVRMVIHQPRIDHYDDHVMTVAELREWAKEPSAAAQKIMSIVDLPKLRPPVGGWQDVKDVPEPMRPHLKPTDKGCRFCDAKAICPALIAEVSDAVSGGRADKSAFKNLTVDTPADVKGYGDNWLAMFATKLDLIETLTKAARAEIDRRVLQQGKTVPGFKVVMGAQGDRAWASKAEAEDALKAMRLPREAIFKSKLISPTEAEKLLKKSSPASWETLQPLITRAEGKPAVVPESDKRAPYDGHKAKASDFKPVATAQGVAVSDKSHPFR